MVFVEQILRQEGGAFWSVAPDAMVIDTLKLMAEKDVGALLVLGAGRRYPNRARRSASHS